MSVLEAAPDTVLDRTRSAGRSARLVIVGASATAIHTPLMEYAVATVYTTVHVRHGAERQAALDKSEQLASALLETGAKSGRTREKHAFSSRKAPFLENCPSGGCGRRGVKHAAKAKKVWPLVTLLSPSLSLSGFGRPLNTPAAFHVHKCQGGIAPARAAAPPLRPRLLLFACQRSHSSAGQAFLSGAQVKDKIVVGSVSLNLWAEGAHHSLKARLKAVRCERPRLPHDLAGRHICQTSRHRIRSKSNTSNATQIHHDHTMHKIVPRRRV